MKLLFQTILQDLREINTRVFSKFIQPAWNSNVFSDCPHVVRSPVRIKVDVNQCYNFVCFVEYFGQVRRFRDSPSKILLRNTPETDRVAGH
nr:MAG TPA: hypothetical protein [Caudoviricetes sp.]